MINGAFYAIFFGVCSRLVSAQFPPPAFPGLNFSNQPAIQTGSGPFQQQPSPFLPSQSAGNFIQNVNPPCIYRGDMRLIDRRAEEGWWNLYPFGERYNDVDMSDKPWKELQIDLDFYLPYYGFRYNYTFIYPEGFIAFNRPQFIQPPYTYPHPRWPDDPDPSFIAAFLTEQTFAHVGETKLSHVWYRVVTSPLFRYRFYDQQRQTSQQNLLAYPGRVEDPVLLSEMTRDIREGMTGARGFEALFALIVTWERMGYGGQPKFLRLDQCRQFKRWLNTYQMVVATDEIRTYIILNYAHINYTSSASAGGWSGRGGRQSALVGFNGGNGTGFTELPYSAQGDSYKLVLYGSTETAGRWLSRIDELIFYGGCTNTSNGLLQLDGRWVNMIGGMVMNVSGPCLRPRDYITMEIDEEIFDCGYVSMVKTACVVPFNAVFKTGYVTIQIAQDGRNYAWVNSLYMALPAMGSPGAIVLVNSISDSTNVWQPDWNKHDIENLTVRWAAANITSSPNARVDLNLYGYWEDVLDREFIKIGSIAVGVANTGVYSFNPRMLAKTDMMVESWKKFRGGVVQVQVSDYEKSDRGDKLYWSKMIPFGWYYRDIWQREYGKDWALQLCVEWFDYDGRRDNFMMELETEYPCPCTLSQAEADFGRFTPLPECDMFGDASCFYSKGAQHCVMSAGVTIRGAAQVCCYDFGGWLMFSQDYEYNLEYLRYSSAGVPYRAHPWGGYRYKKPPHVPSWSNFLNDLLPYDICCRWAERCEFFYWRRMTSGCQNYKPIALASAYGHGHYITFDNVKYTFSGRGYYNLVSFTSPYHDLKVQIRTEQPPKTLYNTHVPATVITGVAMQDNGSSIVQIFSRKEFRRWRYKTDVYVDGGRQLFDRPNKKYMHFNRVAIRSPHLNMNGSELDVMFTTGVGVKVMEMNGYLQVIVSLPPEYNETAVTPGQTEAVSGASRCQNFYRTSGLLGVYNNDPRDDLTNPSCAIVQAQSQSFAELKTIFDEFGERWKIVSNADLLFDRRHPPLYYPRGWSGNFTPIFDPWQDFSNIEEESLVFNRNTEVASTCQNLFSCQYDYLVTGRREDGLETLSLEKKFQGMKQRGQQNLRSCGPLQKNDGVLKYPIGNNYLDGVTVTFSCKVEYFLHGAPQRTCHNGTWSPGWWNWCRSRNEEHALKWMTGLVVSSACVGLIFVLFYWLYKGRYDKRFQRYKVMPNGISSNLYAEDFTRTDRPVQKSDQWSISQESEPRRLFARLPKLLKRGISRRISDLSQELPESVRQKISNEIRSDAQPLPNQDYSSPSIADSSASDHNNQKSRNESPQAVRRPTVKQQKLATITEHVPPPVSPSNQSSASAIAAGRSPYLESSF